MKFRGTAYGQTVNGKPQILQGNFYTFLTELLIHGSILSNVYNMSGRSVSDIVKLSSIMDLLAK